jgi:hypothetical protein
MRFKDYITENTADDLGKALEELIADLHPEDKEWFFKEYLALWDRENQKLSDFIKSPAADAVEKKMIHKLFASRDRGDMNWRTDKIFELRNVMYHSSKALGM